VREYQALEDQRIKSNFSQSNRTIEEVGRSVQRKNPKSGRKKTRMSRGEGGRCMAPRSMAPRSPPRQRHDGRVNAVISWRRRLWRQDKGLFFEIFPPKAYLRESFEKMAKKQKRRYTSICFLVDCTLGSRERLIYCIAAEIQIQPIQTSLT
jgi:hypothetical protein